jgi:hypothetical protein
VARGSRLLILRRHWREGDFWRWLWRERMRGELKVLIAAIVLALMLGGGWAAADRLSSASAGVGASSGGYFTFETTVDRVVTVRESGRIVRKLVPVVKKVFLKPKTSFKTTTAVQTHVVTQAGVVRTVRNKVVVHVPVVSTKVVTVNGKTKTLVTTRLIPTTAIETQTNTLTRVQTQVQVQTQLQTQTQTQTTTNTVTTTKTSTQTNTVTNTVTTTKTVTQPVTVTSTKTVTTTETLPVTVTVPVTITVTSP